MLITWNTSPNTPKNFIVKKWQTWIWLCNRGIHWWIYGTFIPIDVVLTGNSRCCLRCSLPIQIWWARREWINLESYKRYRRSLNLEYDEEDNG